MSARTVVSLAAALLTGSLMTATGAGAQALYAATGPGSYLAVGVSGSAFKTDYGQRKVGGLTLFVDANGYRRIGVEAEVRSLRFHTDEGVRQTTYLIGPKISTHGRTLRPYARLLAGRGKMQFPYGYATGSYFVAAGAGGLDVRLGSGRVILRLVDFEYQVWPNFTFGQMHPYGVSSGISFDVFRMARRSRPE